MMKQLVLGMIAVLMMFSTSFAKDYEFVSIRGLIEQEVGIIVLTEIYKSIGLEIGIDPVPGKRAQSLATSGEKDGEIMRIWTYGENNPTVVRVPTPYYSLETMAFIKKGSGVSIASKEDLAKYKLAKVRGVKHTDNIVKGVPSSQVQDLDSTEKAMKMLQKGRADAVLTNTTDGLLVLKKMGVTDIVPIAQPLAKLDLFNYIHEGKKDVVAKVDAAIKKLKASGELDAIVKKAEAEVIKRLSN